MSGKARDGLRLKLLNANFSVCKTAGEPKINPAAAFWRKTKSESS